MFHCEFDLKFDYEFEFRFYCEFDFEFDYEFEFRLHFEFVFARPFSRGVEPKVAITKHCCKPHMPPAKIENFIKNS
ncbi:unnamed protein product, partial [Nesidiocoris tenuis]